jgi:ATP-dependent DNA helicase
MKEDVEQMLPRKKEIIIYANMTAHQRQIQTHLIEKTFDNYLHESTEIGMHVQPRACLPSYPESNLCTTVNSSMTSVSSIIVLRRPGMKMKLNNLMIQLRKNCAHPDLFNAAFDSTSVSHWTFAIWIAVCACSLTFIYTVLYCCLQASIHLSISFWNNVANFSC